MTTRRVEALTDTHVGRRVTVHGLTGLLTGVIACRHHYVLELRVGGARVYTNTLPAEEPITIHPKETP